MKKIVYLQDNGVVSVVSPIVGAINPSTQKEWTIEEIGKQHVPTGKKYKIVEDSEISSDRSFRMAWTADESSLTDGIGEGEP